MLHAITYALKALCYLLLAALAAPVLFWIYHATPDPRGNLVIDEDLLADDPGTSVDEVN